ncbi:lipoprotein [Streptomyces sp. NPDC101160]|uniref:lipoprotein n=1 Tax=Streptomyces sp. NPDC101160 TaxID=3366118 RepID=UPI00380CD36E
MPERAPLRTTVPAALALLAAGLLTACGTQQEPAAPPAPPAAAPAKPSAAAPKAAAAVPAGSLGGPGTACALPVSFTLAQGWAPNAVKDPENPEFAALTRQGPAVARCEVDAKPAGNIGYLRVWTAPKSAAKDPARTVLEAFVKAETGVKGAAYRDVRAGSLAAVEVTYTVHSEALDETKPERAFAVETPKGTVVVHLGGLDAEEHTAMLPAYELARSTVKPL